MSKFLPSYELSVETLLPESGGSPATVKLGLPLSCEFEVRRAALASSQTATFRVFNLGPRTRDLVQKDWFNLSDVRAVRFRAGYEGEPTATIFNGTLKQAQSTHQGGATDWVTEVEGFDGGAAMANGYSLRAAAAGTGYADLVKTLARDLPGLARTGFVGDLPGKTARGTAFAGPTWNYITQLTTGIATIDNGQLKVLGPNEYAGEEVPSLTAAAGLIGAPQRYLNMLRVNMIFEPKFQVGQLVNLDSSGLTRFNGLYKVMGITHRGLISVSKDAPRRTELTLWNGLGGSDSWVRVPEVALG